MMFIFLIIFLIHNSQSFEWNCTDNKHFLFSNDRITEQCTILIEYLSLQQDEKQICTTNTLTMTNLPLFSFSSNYTMRTFQINSCQLLTLSQLPFSLPSSLETLDLSYNLLSTFILSYPLPFQLKYLYLDHNPNLREIKFGSNHIHQQQLVGLSLRHNKHLQLSSLPRNLMQLDLTDCNLAQSSLVSLLKSLKKLTHLSLADNHLERLPILDRSIELEYLNLSTNALTWIDNKWLHKSLQVLDLRFNQINSLEFFKDILNKSTHDDYQILNTPILQLILYGNPLICDCWLNSLLNSSSINITDLSFLQCNSRSIFDVSSSDFQCFYTRHCTSDCTCCDFEACDCHSVCPSDCLCSHDTLWSQHTVKCRQGNFSHIHILLPETITELNYEENRIEQIKPFVFVGKSLLIKLNLAKNNIRNFTNETFCAATNLQEINLSYNSNLMRILPNMNNLFGCLKNLQYVILSNEQVNEGEIISYGWKIDQNDDLIRVIRTTESSTTVSFDAVFYTTSIYPSFVSVKDPSKLFSIFHHDSFTASNLIQHNQTLIVIVFFLLFFVLLFLLLLISLAICRRKLRRHITAELERQRSHHYYYHTTLHQPIHKTPESLPVNDSLYEQLPSLSSDSEQPFLYNDKKLMNTNAPALPPYPPSFRHYHCCHSSNAHEYLSTMKGYSSPNLQQQQQQQQQVHQPCQAVLIVGSQLIYPNHQECVSELQQNLLAHQQENNPIHYCNNETVFVPTTLCRCKNQMKQVDTYISPSVNR
ncbi:hypothetical protein I4U23_013364 [Adineta vaga]|nr:hypothetical protein I4U23_013364 [Adineta vaga]